MSNNTLLALVGMMLTMVLTALCFRAYVLRASTHDALQDTCCPCQTEYP